MNPRNWTNSWVPGTQAWKGIGSKSSSFPLSQTPPTPTGGSSSCLFMDLLCAPSFLCSSSSAMEGAGTPTLWPPHLNPWELESAQSSSLVGCPSWSSQPGRGEICHMTTPSGSSSGLAPWGVGGPGNKAGGGGWKLRFQDPTQNFPLGDASLLDSPFAVSNPSSVLPLPFLPPTSCGTLGNPLTFSVSPFPHLQSEGNNGTYLTGLF